MVTERGIADASNGPLFAILLAATLAPAPVGAAPQALVVTTAGNVPLACEDSMCAADILTFCLQPERDTR